LATPYISDYIQFERQLQPFFEIELPRSHKRQQQTLHKFGTSRIFSKFQTTKSTTLQRCFSARSLWLGLCDLFQAFGDLEFVKDTDKSADFQAIRRVLDEDRNAQGKDVIC
jgi:hypothetical protein